MKTHTFGRGKYYIDLLDGDVEGYCDIPDRHEKAGKAGKMWLAVPCGSTRHDLQVAVHEGLHAEGFSTEHVDLTDHNGKDAGDRIGAFLWRLGWRKK